ncbi:glycosyltransferase family 4 protein [Chamaesiphon sp.]|uniref:glycosyltransferase family 4 protein n=1 Tax=Chamaesiphon sp. TaxID=2814140 RepID=UPI00359346A1
MHVLISALHRPSKPTGVCRHAANLARCLVDTAEITKVTLLIGAWQRHYFTTVFDLCSHKIDIISIDIKNSSLARNIWFWSGLPELADRLRPDLVHLSFPLPFRRSQFSCPVVATIHDLYPYEYPENFGKIQAFCNRLLLRQCIEQTDGLICVSQTTLDRLKFFFPHRPVSKASPVKIQQKLSVVYNIVDFDEIEPKIPNLVEQRERVSFLLNVAQHRKNKNLDLLINAYALLLETEQIDEAIELIIVGSHGPETANLIRQIQDLKLTAKIHLLAAIDDRELCWLYQHCQAFAIPSAIEGFCLPLAEAIHLSCQVVCSDIPIFREIGSSDCTYFALHGDPIQNLAAAILQTIQQPLQFIDRQSSRFSKKAIASRYLQFYFDVLDRH